MEEVHLHQEKLLYLFLSLDHFACSVQVFSAFKGRLYGLLLAVRKKPLLVRGAFEETISSLFEVHSSLSGPVWVLWFDN